MSSIKIVAAAICGAVIFASVAGIANQVLKAKEPAEQPFLPWAQMKAKMCRDDPHLVICTD